MDVADNGLIEVEVLVRVLLLKKAFVAEAPVQTDVLSAIFSHLCGQECGTFMLHW